MYIYIYIHIHIYIYIYIYIHAAGRRWLLLGDTFSASVATPRMQNVRATCERPSRGKRAFAFPAQPLANFSSSRGDVLQNKGTPPGSLDLRVLKTKSWQRSWLSQPG